MTKHNRPSRTGKNHAGNNTMPRREKPTEFPSLAAVINYLDRHIPLRLAEPWDNVGLLAGPRRELREKIKVKRIRVALDLTPAVKDQCLADAVDLLVCYHPPIFKPVERLCVQGDTPADLAIELAQNKVWIFSPHTALDVVDNGTNDALAAALDLSPRGSIQLRKQTEPQLKLVVYVPENHVEEVAEAVFQAGAGQIGKESRYTQCSFRTSGTGTFFGDQTTSPAVGSSGRLEFVPEIRFETVVPESRVAAVVAALRQAHPYEEPAFDLLIMQAEYGEPGMGRIVELPQPQTLENLGRRCKRLLGLEVVQVLGHSKRRIKKLGILAGSCGQLPLHDGKKLDCVITGELKHHDMLAFQAADVAAIILGHAESEKPVMSVLTRQLSAAFPAVNVQVLCHSKMLGLTRNPGDAGRVH